MKGNIKLGKRLSAIVKLIPRCGLAADIGTGDGLIPIYLVDKGICPYVIAGDAKPGSLTMAKKNIEYASLGGRIETRLGNGLEVIGKDRPDVVIIAGMGGRTIREILENGCTFIPKDAEVIMQPMRDMAKLRKWLIFNGFPIVKEELVREQGRYYQIIGCKFAPDYQPDESDKSELALEIGPRLLEHGHPLLGEYAAYLLNRDTRILKELRHAQERHVTKKVQQLEKSIKLYERLIESAHQA